MIDIFNMIEREMANKHMSKAELSRKLNLHHSTVKGMLSRKTIMAQRLIELSEILNYNFFGEIAQQLSVENPLLELRIKLKEEELTKEINRLNEKINSLTQDNKNLELKSDVLESVIEKIGIK